MGHKNRGQVRLFDLKVDSDSCFFFYPAGCFPELIGRVSYFIFLLSLRNLFMGVKDAKSRKVASAEFVFFLL